MKSAELMIGTLSHRILRIASSCLILAVAPSFAAQQRAKDRAVGETIERIEFIGNRRVGTKTLHDRLPIQSGDRFTAEAVQQDFFALWTTHFFSDERVEVEDSPDLPNGKIVIFYLKEKPIVGRIEFKGTGTITESDILGALKEGNVDLSVMKRFEPADLAAAAVVVRGLLNIRGYPWATVTPSYEQIPSTDRVKVVFDIREGPAAEPTKLP
jgi:outer membrane protein insertion porin family